MDYSKNRKYVKISNNRNQNPNLQF